MDLLRELLQELLLVLLLLLLLYELNITAAGAGDRE